MTSDRLGRILSQGALGDDPAGVGGRLCRACVKELEVVGAALAVVVAGENRGTLGASDDWTAAVEELQFTLGEGPGLDAATSGHAVLEPWLAGSERWPQFGQEAASAGVGAVFAVPLAIGAARFGALDLYRDRPGPLGDGAFVDAVAVAAVATVMVANALSQVPPSPELGLVDILAERRIVVDQATGMVAVQLGVSLEEALVALRARSYTDGHPVGVVAAGVVARRIRFDR